MYTVTLQNFASTPAEFPDYQQALERAKGLGFESCVWFTDSEAETHLVASYSPLYGLRTHSRSLAGMAPGLTLDDALEIVANRK